MKMLKKHLVKFVNYIHSRYCDSIYNIGLIDYSDSYLYSSALPEIQWLKHDFTDRWFADPFIVDSDEYGYTIFVETYFYKKRKGVIGRIRATRDFVLKEYSTILELDTHLSFPAFYRKDGEIYVYPENSRSGKLNLYEYDRQSDCLRIKNVLSDAPLTDAVITKVDNDFYLLATTSHDPNGKTCSFYMPAECGEYFEDSGISQEMIDHTARGAGLPFKSGERLIRPAQVCNGAYGIGIALQELQIKCGKPLLTELNRFMVYDNKYNAGFHTFNRHKDVVVVDGYYYPSKIGVRLFKFLNNLFFSK